MTRMPAFALLITLLVFVTAAAAQSPAADSARDDRMAWWRDARFGMFIHWGLYAIPGGEWKDGPNAGANHGVWIRTTAQIPLAEYDKLLEKFNPVNFNAEAIVLAAKNAGMGYIIITSKHHDGFCLFDTATTDFDVMSTPFKRDILRELADACRKHGLRIGWYYSIMDWHHPDYLPRREWETDRPTEVADFDRYVTYMKAQLKELLTNYGDIGVLWFDGQWEGNWTDDRGRDLEAYVRSLAPDIIINSRVGRAGGNYGLDTAGGMLGDYATPEQFIPDSDPGFDWETCMTMNDHWGYNRADRNYKTTGDLIRKLVDIASKGGNFLLNIGPDELGNIPPASLERLREIGEWWEINSESIRGTRAGPFPANHLPWGRCTQRLLRADVPHYRLFLHVFDWPADGRVVIPGIYNTTTGEQACLLINLVDSKLLVVGRDGADLVLPVPPDPVNPFDTVIQLDVSGTPDIAIPPTIIAPADIFIDTLPVTLASKRGNIVIRYTLDGAEPTADSPAAQETIALDRTATLRAACFREGVQVSPVASREFRKVTPRLAIAAPAATNPGLLASVFTWESGDIESVEALAAMQPVTTAPVPDLTLKHVQPRERFWGAQWHGLLRVPKTAVYEFTTGSDDGGRLWIGDQLVVDNDRPHSFKVERGVIALEAGLHPIRIAFFENWGGFDLRVSWREIAHAEKPIFTADLVHEP